MIRSAEEFVRLRTSEDPALQARAAHDAAPQDVWLDVIRQYPDVRMWVAQNKTVPSDILAILANDPDESVRWMVAQKRKADPAILERLASDAAESVRQRVALNPKTPLRILQRLAQDQSEFVSEAARRRLERPSP